MTAARMRVVVLAALVWGAAVTALVLSSDHLEARVLWAIFGTILVLSFVGYYAAHQQAGALSPLIAGSLGALFVTWVTFVPSFIWIFLGAPYIERLRKNRYLSAMLATVTAAVVGVIANLALWFALHVLFGEVREVSAGVATFAWPAWQSINPAAIALSLAAGLALLHWRVNLVRVLLATGAVGYLLQGATS